MNDRTPEPHIPPVGRKPLDAIFRPRTVAVLGATEKPGSVGRTLLWNLVSSPFGGTVFPVNPNRSAILGVKAYPSLRACPDPVELAVICTPASSVPGIMAECRELGVRGAIVISAGFKEVGPQGVELERQVLEQARRGEMRIIGPNCLGVMNCRTGLNATFANGIASPGNVGFISQSGALCTAVLDWSRKANVGFSAFVSIGSMLDVGWGDLIDYLGSDPDTNAIVIYMESIGDARAFLSAAREVALTKPIIVIKPGRTEGAAKAAASHTGSMTGSDEVLEAAFRRCGVLRVNSISDLFDMSEVLAKQPRPKGNRLTMITNAGGPGVLATDALLMNGGALAEISAETTKKLDAVLPPHWSHNNPIDVLGDAGADRYAKTLEIAAQDPNSDGLLVILTPQAMTESTATAELLRPYAQSTGKPILASWMGGADVEEGERILNEAHIPAFDHPDRAVRAFTYMWKYTYALRGIYETPALPTGTGANVPDRAKAAELFAHARNNGRTLLTEAESKQLLAAYHIPTIDTLIASTPDEAVEAARRVGFPVVLKLHSEVITHKTDVGGVVLDLKTEAEVKETFERIRNNVLRKAGERAKDGQPTFLGVTVQPMVKVEGYELILGSSIDPQFGPVLLFGTGGQLVEVYKDRALGLPPLNSTLARRMMEGTRVYHALRGVRGRAPVDLAALEQLLVRFSTLIVEQPCIQELDINPLVASPERIVALDARVLLHPAGTRDEDLPRTAIRPYPTQYQTQWKSPDGVEVFIRPLRPEDEALLHKFHEGLSDRSVYMRFLEPLSFDRRVAHERLSQICFIDYDRAMALAAEVQTDGSRSIVGVVRLTKVPGTRIATFNVIVHDSFQRRGIGTELVQRVLQVARDEGLTQVISSDVLTENQPMLRLADKLGLRWTAMGDGRGKLELEI